MKVRALITLLVVACLAAACGIYSFSGTSIQPDVAVLCVPKTMANEVAKEVCACGVHSLWNFTNTELQLEDTDVIVENIHFSDSLLALGYYLSESLDEAEAKAARARKDV